LERRGLETKSFNRSVSDNEKKKDDSAMYIMRKSKCFFDLEACKPIAGDLQKKN